MSLTFIVPERGRGGESLARMGGLSFLISRRWRYCGNGEKTMNLGGSYGESKVHSQTKINNNRTEVSSPRAVGY